MHKSMCGHTFLFLGLLGPTELTPEAQFPRSPWTHRLMGRLAMSNVLRKKQHDVTRIAYEKQSS